MEALLNIQAPSSMAEQVWEAYFNCDMCLSHHGSNWCGSLMLWDQLQLDL